MRPAYDWRWIRGGQDLYFLLSTHSTIAQPWAVLWTGWRRLSEIGWLQQDPFPWFTRMFDLNHFELWSTKRILQFQAPAKIAEFFKNPLGLVSMIFVRDQAYNFQKAILEIEGNEICAIDVIRAVNRLNTNIESRLQNNYVSP